VVQDHVCVVCRTPCNVEPTSSDAHAISCPRCGGFSITGTAVAVLDGNPLTPRQVANASGWLRERPGVTITSSDLDALRGIASPTVIERAEKLLRQIERRTPRLGAFVEVRFPPETELGRWLGMSWSLDEAEFQFLLVDVLQRGNYIVYKHHGSGGQRTYKMSITPEGYERLEEMNRGTSDSQVGFCAMWFKPSMQSVWLDAIEPAIEGAGYEPKRVDTHEHNNKIDDEIIALIRRSRFVVADCTGNRGGVYFEAGLALGLQRSVFWTCRERRLHRVHFDARQYNFIEWTADKLPEFKQRLQNRIEATIGRGPYVRPARAR
jgi:hypothetical protein